MYVISGTIDYFGGAVSFICLVIIMGMVSGYITNSFIMLVYIGMSTTGFFRNNRFGECLVILVDDYRCFVGGAGSGTNIGSIHALFVVCGGVRSGA